MEEGKIIDVDFGKRLLGLREEKGLSREAAAKEIGIGLSSLQNYEKGSIPIPVKLEKILLYYKCNRTWLREGEPYQKTGSPEPSTGPAYIKEGLDQYGQRAPGASQTPPGTEIRISEAMTMAARVLESGTSYATALYLNIVHFDRAVSSEAVMFKCQQDLHDQGKLIVKMQERLDKMDNLNNKLTEEIRELKRTRGDSPPTALGMDHAALTGTDDPA